ncbi:NifB/NifX family molybdenum-iron cluster-binding protein [Marinobacterium sp. YM272]|uniref:NifB/NifX family molybdenum-iron cluster-binding protein n=1 Tax=Marinobacterium sp. YM272 TaxID=3421654 RepID=UPI003D7F5EF2
MNTAVSVECVADAIDNEQALIVAFASQDGDMVDQHFGSAQAFYTWAVTADSAELIASRDFGYEKKDGNEDKLKPKMAWLVGADVVYCGSIGGSATRQLVTLGINPIKVKGGPDVEELVDSLQAQLASDAPEFWLANILKRKRSNGDDRFDLMEDEGWDD